MLTVLWRKHDGSEMLFAAESVERDAGSEAQVPACGAFWARGVKFSDSPDGDYRFAIEQPFGAVFVMNAEGRTVARYLSSH